MKSIIIHPEIMVDEYSNLKQPASDLKNDNGLISKKLVSGYRGDINMVT